MTELCCQDFSDALGIKRSCIETETHKSNITKFVKLVRVDNGVFAILLKSEFNHLFEMFLSN